MPKPEADDFPVLRDLHNPAGQDALVDLVFVHGLNGHFRNTWTAKNASRPWIEDPEFLGDLKHKVRVLSFGYNANRFDEVACTRTIHHAISLLRALDIKRRDCPGRPIIFIAHSLGGLVVKKAIVLTPSNPDWPPIKSATKAILFMGTPHMGSDQARNLKLLQNLWSWAQLKQAVGTNLTQELDPSSNLVQDMIQEFSLHVHRSIYLLCFYESKPQRLPSGKSTIVVPQSSAVLQGVDSQELSCTHSELPKFKSPTEARFETFWGEVRLRVKRATEESQLELEKGFSHMGTPTLYSQETPGKYVQSPLWLVPFERNKTFVGRDAILQQLVEKADPYADTERTQRTAVDGLGGIGKTQIALETACRIRDKHPDCSVFWVPAIDATSFENAYREIGRELRVRGIDEYNADVKSLVKAALGHRDSSTWLLVVDNADDAKLLLDKTTSSLAQYLPSNKNGSILFTTRNRGVAVDLVGTRPEDIITVGEMDRDEARQLLTMGLKDEQVRDAASTASLLDLLANLPLAIKQATSYMAKTGITITRYLDDYRSSNADESMAKLLSRDFEDRTRYRGTNNPVATTWLISFEHISRDNQLAAEYLRLISFLAEKDIPTSFLRPADYGLQFDEAIGALKAYAFITQREDQDSFDIHRLVALAMRNWLDSKGEHAAYREKSIRRVAENFPFPKYENRDEWTKCLPHALSVLRLRRATADNGKGEGDPTPPPWKQGLNKMWTKYGRPVLNSRSGVADRGMPERYLLLRVGNSLRFQGKYAEAEAVHRRALELAEKALDSDHADVLNLLNTLGVTLEDGGKYDEAEAIHRRALKLCGKTLGQDHRDTLESMNNLGSTLISQGKYAEAAEMHQTTLDLKEKALGQGHPETFTSINNLANALYSQGKYAEAEEMHRKVFSLMDRALGHDHPDILPSMTNLGNALFSQAKYTEAAEMYQKVLGLSDKVHGHDHPKTIRCMINLGNVLKSQGKHAEAERVYRKALGLNERVLGCDHPVTIMSMTNLGIELSSQGKYVEATEVFQQTIERSKTALGCDHPDTLVNMGVLGQIRILQRRNVEAEEMLQHVSELMEKVLGYDHQDTLKYTDSLALALYQQAKYVEAEAMYRHVSELRAKVLGCDHRDTLQSRQGLRDALNEQGKNPEAEQGKNPEAEQGKDPEAEQG